jgi:hypothetical protein
MLRIAVPVVAVMLALLTGMGTKAPARQFPIYPRPGGPPSAAAAMVKGTSLAAPRRASSTAGDSLQLRVQLSP